ncbi:TonB-dependent receptor [Sphingomonas morindae]|uniref:TonB-dependent receptor n=1 Tax=Sphingomonas morindae TaxID=1541170 RepID=A0ABY4X5T6_9SPHN|nr:TonB-dependent receptor [Sphingomonas morindae]USI72231.1 TonB-dependent receptor [Sphingomonas morindae]
MAVAGLLSSTAYAQVTAAGEPAADPTTAASGEPQSIVVTGTRIRRPNLQSNSPVTIVGSQEIQYQGATTVEGVLARLPQVTADANENVSNGSDGTANINLRNLGANRTLILINGQRMLPQQAVDLNFVPAALIDRVDVLTGGASAVYGSDALAGVVNFVLRNNLEGVRVDVQNSVAQHENGAGRLQDIVTAQGYQTAPRSVVDGAKQDVNVSAGKNFAGGRGNISIFGGYRHFDPIIQSNRDVSACALQAADAAGTALNCGGSSNTPYGSFTPLAGPNQGKALTNAADGSKTWVPYTSAYTYNYAPLNYFQRSDNRYTAGAFAHFDVSSALKLYGSFMYMNDRTFSQVAPSALFLGSPFTLACNQPLMSAQQLSALCGTAAGTSETRDTLIGYRLGGNGTLPRRDDLRHEDWRYSAGARGDLGHGFSYDINAMRALVRYDETYLNNVDAVKAQRALDIVNNNGTLTCRSVLDGSDPACVPINVFQANGLTADQATYLYSPSHTRSRNTLTTVTGAITSDLGTFGLKSPWAEQGASLVLGGEHRRETLNFFADEIAQQGGATNSDGSITVNEAFGELEVPLLANKPFAETLTVNGGFRYSAYKNKQGSTGFGSSYNVWTYKAELSWAPIHDLRLRGSYNRAIRAPNIGELFASQSVGNVSAQDPCAGATPQASQAACALTGVSATQYGSIIPCPADTCSAQAGGNRALKPEQGDTYTVGMVLTPRMMRGFSLSVDYFRIKVSDYINSIDPSLTINQCQQTGDPFYCGLFHRDPRSGALFGNSGYVVSTTLNTGFLRTAGIDVTADYTAPLGQLGKLNLNLVGTWVQERVASPLPGLGSYDCKGRFGYSCGQPTPAWRHSLRTTWETPWSHASLSLNWRYYGRVTLSSLSDNSFLAGTPSVVNRRIKAYNYFDLAATVDVAKRLTLRVGANNLLDRDPPAIAAGILSAFGNGNTYPGIYDVAGRTLFAGLTASF